MLSLVRLIAYLKENTSSPAFTEVNKLQLNYKP